MLVVFGWGGGGGFGQIKLTSRGIEGRGGGHRETRTSPSPTFTWSSNLFISHDVKDPSSLVSKLISIFFPPMMKQRKTDANINFQCWFVNCFTVKSIVFLSSIEGNEAPVHEKWGGGVIYM